MINKGRSHQRQRQLKDPSAEKINVTPAKDFFLEIHAFLSAIQHSTGLFGIWGWKKILVKKSENGNNNSVLNKKIHFKV